MKQIASIFEDTDGGLSTMRVVLVIWTLAMAIVWTWCSCQAGDPLPLPESVVTAFAALVAGKVVQRKVEQSKAEPNSINSPK